VFRKVVVRARLGRGAQWLVGPKITCLGSVRSRRPGMAPIGRGTPLQRRHDRRTPRCGFPLQSPQFSPTKPDGLEGHPPAGCGAGPACEAKRPSARAAPPACAAKKLIPAPPRHAAYSSLHPHTGLRYRWRLAREGAGTTSEVYRSQRSAGCRTLLIRRRMGVKLPRKMGRRNFIPPVVKCAGACAGRG
jgi:hypothetical protein